MSGCLDLIAKHGTLLGFLISGQLSITASGGLAKPASISALMTDRPAATKPERQQVPADSDQKLHRADKAGPKDGAHQEAVQNTLQRNTFKAWRFHHPPPAGSLIKAPPSAMVN